MSRASQFSLAAAQQALADAGLTPPLGEAAGVLLGTGVGGLEWALAQARVFWEHGLARVNPFSVTASLANMPAHHVSHWVQALGPISTVVTACAAGTQAVGEAAEVIRRRAADPYCLPEGLGCATWIGSGGGRPRCSGGLPQAQDSRRELLR